MGKHARPRINFAVSNQTKEQLQQLAESEHRTLSNLIEAIIADYLEEKKHRASNLSESRTTIDLTHLKDRIENLRSDSAWQKLKLSAKVTVLLFEYLDLLESGNKPKNGNRTVNLSENLTNNGDHLSESDCVTAAREVGIPEELALKLCDRLFEKKD